jgi:hypothetical protein
MNDLPGAELVLKGLTDARQGLSTVESCLVWIASIRLREHNLLGDDMPERPAECERILYKLLQANGGNAYGRYNSLKRRLTSFLHALDQQRRHARKTSE